MKKITFLILSLFLATLSWQVQAQCTGTFQWPTGTFTPTSGAGFQTINGCSFAGDFAVIAVTTGDTYIFSTCPADGATATYDTQLTLRTTAGALLAYNDDFCGLQSRITWISTITGTVRLHLHQFNCATNSTCTAIRVSRTTPPPVNNLCANATLITGNGTYPGTTLGSTNSAAGTCVVTSSSGDVWYRFTDVSGGGMNINANTCSSIGYDTKLSVFRGSCGALVCVTGNDDAACAFSGLRSAVNFTTDGSSTYYIMVHGFGTATGNFELNISGMMVGSPPQIICPNDIVINNTTGTCGAQVFFNNASAFDPEDGLIPVTQTMGPGTGSIFPIGDTIIEYSATDSDNNTSTCQFTITVLDVDDPIAVCQDITVELDAMGSVTINAADLDGGSSDFCGAVTFSFDMAGAITTMMFDCADLGENTITLYVTDEGGNVVTCQSIVTVEDNIAPMIVCSGSSTSVTDSVSASPGVAIPDNNPTGVSSTLNVTDDEIITDIDIDVNINHTWVGDVTVRITSPAGTMVTIIDRPGVPTTTFGCSGNDIIATLDDDAPSPVETQCAAAVPTINGTFSPNNPLSAFNGESTLGTWTITVFDSAGGDTGTLNSWAVVYSYDVVGGAIPQYVLDINGEVTVDINDLYTSASDNCTVTVSAGGPGSTGPCNASNPSNAFQNGKSNTAALNRIVANDLTVGDGEDFLLESISFNEFISPATNVSFVNVYVYANAGGAPGALITSETNIIPTSQAVVGGNFGFDVRQVIVNITPVNLAGQTGNTTTYWIGISVQAADASNVFWENTTVSSNGLGEAYNDGLGGGFIIDNTLDGVYTFSGSCSTGGGGGLTFTCADLGIVNVIVTATDSSGNTTSCTTQIEIIDNMPPVITGEDITVELGPDGTVCIEPEDLFGIIPPEYNVITISSDNGSGAVGFTDFVVTVAQSVSVSFDWSYTTNDGPAFDSFGYIINGVYTQLTNPGGANNQTGNATVPLTAGQVFGFRSRSEDGIFGPSTTTVSNFQPGFTGQFDPVNWTQILTNSDGSAVFVEITPGSSSAFDNCGITVTAIDISCFSCADIGTPVTVTIFASDASGNIASTTAVVTVVDLLGPVIGCPADMTVDTDPNSVTYTLPDYIGDGLVTITDNCTDPVTIFSQTPAPGSLLLDGTYTITFTAEDEYGNESSCSFELTVETILGTNENELSNAIAMYPNPASGHVILRNNSTILLSDASIYDITGKLVSKFDLSQMNGEQRLDVSNLASGVYLVYINSETASVVKRLIKK